MKHSTIMILLFFRLANLNKWNTLNPMQHELYQSSNGSWSKHNSTMKCVKLYLAAI